MRGSAALIHKLCGTHGFSTTNHLLFLDIRVQHNFSAMTVIHIRGLGGGIGTSAFAWCLARAVGALLIDQSNHPGGVLWSAGVTGQWPRIVGSGVLAPSEFDKFESGLTEVAGVRICSGGSPPPSPIVRQLVASAPIDRHVVIDGNITDALSTDWRSVVVSSNSIPHIRELESVTADFTVCAFQNSGLPPQIVRHVVPNVLTFKNQRKVQKGISGGYGVDGHSDIAECASKLAQQILALDGL